VSELLTPPYIGAARRALDAAWRWRSLIAVGILLYAAIIGLTGGFDVTFGPLRLRSHHTDWLLRIATLAALAGLLFRENTRGLRAAAMRHGRDIYAWVRPRIPRTAIALLVLSAALWAIGAAVALLPAEMPSGDMALLELYTRQAAHGALRVGPYSRFQWNHPGPAMFYVFTPLYSLFGERFESLRLSALILNLGWLCTALAVVARRGKPALLLTTALGLALLLFRSSDVLVSPWNPHLLLLPIAVLFVSCAAVLQGAFALFAMAVAAASFVIQTHLSTAPLMAFLLCATVLIVVVRFTDRGSTAKYRRALNLALWLGLAMWFLPLADEVTSSPGNLTAIFRFFVEPNYSPVSRDSYRAFFRMLSAAVMPGFETAWGGQIVRPDSLVGFAISLGVLIGLPWTASKARASGDRFTSDLSVLLVASSVAVLWSLLRIRGEVLDQLVFWITIIGILNISCLVAPFLTAVRREHAKIAAIVSVLAVTTVGAVELRRTSRPFDAEAALRIRQGYGAVSAYLEREHLSRPLVFIAHPAWDEVAGVVVLLDKAGRKVMIEPQWLYMFGHQFSSDGTHDSELVFADAEQRPSIVAAGRHVILGEWPELTIFGRPAGAHP
jgi:hypothetical protein